MSHNGRPFNRDDFRRCARSDRLWEAWIRSFAQTIYHPVSTCAINQATGWGLVDGNQHCYGLLDRWEPKNSIIFELEDDLCHFTHDKF
jgi:hypothetical protein